MDAETWAIRWAHNRFTSMHLVHDVRLADNARPMLSTKESALQVVSAPLRLARGISSQAISDNLQVDGSRKASMTQRRTSFAEQESTASRRTRAQLNTVLISYSGRTGLQQVLELQMRRSVAHAWHLGLMDLMKLVPASAKPAHWRWALACMAATSERGATGFLPRSWLRSLLRRANASARLSVTSLAEALKGCEQRLDLPDWRLPTGGEESKVLNAQQVTGLLLGLSTSSLTITEIFNHYAVDGSLGLSQWLA